MENMEVEPNMMFKNDDDHDNDDEIWLSENADCTFAIRSSLICYGKNVVNIEN